MSLSNKVSNMLVKDIYSTYQTVRNVYVHLPFCQKKCHFCAFPIHAISSNQSQEMEVFKDKYIEYLLKQIKVSEPFRKLSNSLQSLYFGGGTPSLYSSIQLDKICSMFQTKGTQISLQLNPTQLIRLDQFKQTRINRFSIGIQTFDRELLEKMNRPCLTTREQLLTLVEDNRPENLSLDFIIDFCIQEKYFDQMIDAISKINPQHVTLYILERNDGSYLKKNPQQFEWLPPDNQVIKRYVEASQRLQALGYDHYEVSNFARDKKFQSKHNHCYWDGNRQFLAYGMGAAHLARGLRITKPSTVSRYFKYVNTLQQFAQFYPNQLRLAVYDESNWRDELQTVLMSGLRRKKGVKWQSIEQITFQNYKKVKSNLLNQLNKIEEDQPELINLQYLDEIIALNAPKGYLLADEITYRLINNLSK